MKITGHAKAGGFNCLFELNNECALITGVEGMDSVLEVPETVTFEGAEYPVTEIAKKALLGVNGLRHIILPASVTTIGDWAFSHCIHLVSLVILGENVSFGRGMLEGCARLKSICVGYSGEDDLAYLTAAAINRLQAVYLLGSSDAGSEKWYQNFDSSLIQFLEESDYAGSSEAALCGEEDISYDDIRSVDGELLGVDAAYIWGVRKNKSYLCLLRLIHNEKMSDGTREYLENYIEEHSAGRENNAAWLTIREDLYEDNTFLNLYLEITAPSVSDIELMLADLGNDHPQMKAQLLKYKTDNGLGSDFFDDLLL